MFNLEVLWLMVRLCACLSACLPIRQSPMEISIRQREEFGRKKKIFRFLFGAFSVMHK